MSLRDSRDRRWRAYASLAAAVLGMSWSAVLTLLVVCLSTGVPLAGYSGRTWASLFALGLISQFAAYFAFVYALGHLPATLTSVANLAQIPLAALLGVPLLGEPVSRAQVAGGMLVLTGIYVVSQATAAEPLNPEPSMQDPDRDQRFSALAAAVRLDRDDELAAGDR